MRTHVLRLAAGAALAGSTIAAILPGFVLATVTGGCQVTGTSTSGGSVDLTSAAEWHLKKSDVAGGSGTAPSEQTAASVSAYGLGLGLPIANGSGDGGTEGAVQGVSVEPYASLGARFLVAGQSAGEGGGCQGQVLIIIDDVNPAMTALGGGGILAAVLGALVLLGTARLGGGIPSRAAGLLFGFIGGVGLALALEQFGVLDPRSFIGLVIAIAGAVLGVLVPGTLHRKPASPTAPPEPAPAA